jgi:hypothetical protein
MLSETASPVPSPASCKLPPAASLCPYSVEQSGDNLTRRRSMMWLLSIYMLWVNRGARRYGKRGIPVNFVM